MTIRFFSFQLAQRAHRLTHPLLLLPALLAIALGSAGCGGSEPIVEQAENEVPIAGLYEVVGVTRDAATGANERTIKGKIVILTEGDRYTSTFELTTQFPGLVDHVASVIGKGEGTIEGRELSGTTETQIVSSVVPGIDAGFAFIPRSLTARIRSTSKAVIKPDGTAVLTIESVGVEGEDYRPTRTKLAGIRIGAGPIEVTSSSPSAGDDP